MEQNVVQKAPEQAKKSTPNLTGIPTQMKLDFERRSGLSFDDVRVHYNSDKPRKIGALAYTQIPQVHIGPGQERHLRHELGHVVQQKQGIVRPTKKQDGISINDSAEMEDSADRIMFSTYHHSRVQMHNIYPGIIQKRDFSAGISLIPAETIDKVYTAHEVVLDALNLHGRTDTGIDEKAPAIQGDHTIADVFIKRFQKESVTGLVLYDVIKKYQQWLGLIENVNASLRKKFEELTIKSPGDYKRLLVSEQFVDFGNKIANDALIDGKSYKLTFWRILLKRLVTSYNVAYSHNPLSATAHEATGEKRAGGRNEGQCFKRLRNGQSNPVGTGTSSETGGSSTPTKSDADLSASFTKNLASLIDPPAISRVEKRLKVLEECKLDESQIDKATAIVKLLTHSELHDIMNRILVARKASPIMLKFIDMTYALIVEHPLSKEEDVARKYMAARRALSKHMTVPTISVKNVDASK